MPKRTVVLTSGGMDSAVLLWKAKEVFGPENVKALSFYYGQRHSVEIDAAGKLANQAGVEWDCANIQPINRLINKGSQSGPVTPPDGHYTEESMKVTIVPNRNMIMIAIAVGHAITIGAESVYIAAHSGDHAIYPDCRDASLTALDKAIRLCNEWDNIKLIHPFTHMSKTELVELGVQLKVPFELTWSCYKGGDKHCGTCGTCVERKEAFQLAGVEDPTIYG